MSETGELKSVAILDTSEYDDAINHMVDSTVNASNEIVSATAKIQEQLNDIPEVNIDFLKTISSAKEMKEGIGQAFAHIAGVIRQNEEAIVELRQKYNQAREEANKFANVPSMREHYNELQQQKKAINELIAARKQAISVAKEEEAALKKEANSLIETAKQKEKNASATTSLKQRIKELEAEAAALVEAAQKEGKQLDQNTGRYREIIEELGRLRDIRGDIQQAGSVFANDEARIAGVIQGLSGLSGAFTVAQGTIGLFGSENEKLNEIMLKVQSLMAITMGLQQMQQILNKDSTFSLVTLNSIKKLFKDTTQEEVEAIADENEEIAENIEEVEKAIVANTLQQASEEANTLSTTENSEAETLNAASKEAKAVASGEAAVAVEGESVANTVEAATAEAGAAANFTLAGAFRAVGTAIKSIPVFGWIIAGITALIAIISAFSKETEKAKSEVDDLIDAEKRAEAEAERQKRALDSVTKSVEAERAALELNIAKTKNFVGTKEQEKKIVDELNSKYGETMGYFDSVAEWYGALIANSEKYCQQMIIEAQTREIANQIAQKEQENYNIRYDDKGNARRYSTTRQYKQEVAEYRYVNGVAAHTYRNVEIPGTSDLDKANKALRDNAEAIANLKKRLNGLVAEAANISFAVTGSAIKPGSGTVPGGSAIKPNEQIAKDKEALERWKESVKQYMKDAYAEIEEAEISAMESGLEKDLKELHFQTQQKVQAWGDSFLQLAEVLKEYEKQVFLSKKGNTEEMWNNSERGKMSLMDYANEILKDPEYADLSKEYYQRLQQITQEEEKKILEIKQQYQDKWIDEYGNSQQKRELLVRQWNERLASIAKEAPEMMAQATLAMQKELSNLDFEEFKKNINWADIFGSLDDQALQSLQVSLDNAVKYLNQNISSMSVEQIKALQEAIDKIEDEIASRNPFTAMHKSFSDISDAKTEFVSAMSEMKSAQEEVTAAQEAYNKAKSETQSLQTSINSSYNTDGAMALVDAQHQYLQSERDYQAALEKRNELQAKVDSGELAANSKEYLDAVNAVTDAERARGEALSEREAIAEGLGDDELAQQCIDLVDAQERLQKSETTLTSARERSTKAENNVLTARNKITKSYKNFANNLNAAGQVATDVGKKASNLARVFSDDIADGMDKALDCIDEVLDATTDVISAIGDVGKSVAKGMTQTVDAMGQATQSTATATATSISTVEKASVILTVISAALQIATAIASLFNNDDKKQKEIDKLQERIDQLQWELDNQDAVRLQKNVGNALEQVTLMYQKAREEVLSLHGVMQNANSWAKWIAANRYEAEIYAKQVEKIADYWANVDYTADKALGAEKYAQSRKQLENLAEQQILIQKQLQNEESKKDSDSGAIQDYKNKLAEIAEEMATLINEMLEDIIGQSAEDLAKTLGDAFFEAVKSGEDAMEAWRDKVNEIVADIMQRMMITKFLEEPLGEIFNKYRKRWFGDDGKFKGIDAITGSMTEFSNDLNEVGATFKALMDELPDEVKQWFTGDEERSASERGIATASQDSVDENNARLTVIQSHTYTLVQGVAELNATGSAMLDRLASIDANTAQTADTLDDVQTDVKRLRNAVEDITTQGIRMKS